MQPTAQQLKLLKLMAVGARISIGVRGSMYQLTIPPSQVIVFRVQLRTVQQMYSAGWLGFEAGRGYTITAAGRAHTEVSTHVRAFAE